jgi:hypothetical protein
MTTLPAWLAPGATVLEIRESPDKYALFDADVTLVFVTGLSEFLEGNHGEYPTPEGKGSC